MTESNNNTLRAFNILNIENSSEQNESEPIICFKVSGDLEKEASVIKELSASASKFIGFLHSIFSRAQIKVIRSILDTGGHLSRSSKGDLSKKFFKELDAKFSKERQKELIYAYLLCYSVLNEEGSVERTNFMVYKTPFTPKERDSKKTGDSFKDKKGLRIEEYKKHKELAVAIFGHVPKEGEELKIAGLEIIYKYSWTDLTTLLLKLGATEEDIKKLRNFKKLSAEKARQAELRKREEAVQEELAKKEESLKKKSVNEKIFLDQLKESLPQIIKELKQHYKKPTASIVFGQKETIKFDTIGFLMVGASAEIDNVVKKLKYYGNSISSAYHKLWVILEKSTGLTPTQKNQFKEYTQLLENNSIFCAPYLHLTDALRVVGQPRSIFDYFIAEGLLFPSHSKNFSKWGKTLSVDYFSTQTLISKVLPNLSLWIENKNKSFISKDQNLLIKKISGSDHRWDVILNAKVSVDIFQFEDNDDSLFQLKVPFGYHVEVEAPIKRKNGHVYYDKPAIEHYANQKQLLLTTENSPDNLKFKNSLKYKNLQSAIKKCVSACRFNKAELEQLQKHLQKIPYNSITNATTFQSIFNKIPEVLAKKKKWADLAASKVANMSSFEQHFPLARSLKRNLHLFVGPTNSGKTYEALQALEKASSGIYLGPLRLLALEVFNKLTEKGISCNLVTGEEQHIVPGATHWATTIEMAQFSKKFEVAVIDEYQLMLDPIAYPRGAAWTNAILGIAANDVYLCGTPEYKQAVQEIAKITGDSLYFQEKSRLCPLKYIGRIKVNQIKAQDAIVVFSRQDVLAYSTLLKERGLSVSCIYGALSPEIRAEQARLFETGANTVLVTTDAIGMGLNLPIKRILFGCLKKFDGIETRELYPQEFAQIAGRAGRFGIHDNGEVGVLLPPLQGMHRHDEEAILELSKTINKIDTLYGEATLLNKAQKLVLPVRPMPFMMNALSEEIGEGLSLESILDCFNQLREASANSESKIVYESDDLSAQKELLLSYGSLVRKLPLSAQYALSCAPVNVDDKIADIFSNFIRKLITLSLSKSEEGSKNLLLNLILNENSLSDISWDSLEEAELSIKLLGLYLWTAHTCERLVTVEKSMHPRTLLFFNVEKAIKARKNLSGYISEELAEYYQDRFSKLLISPPVRRHREDDDDFDIEDIYDSYA